jgi:hypothetical protein
MHWKWRARLGLLAGFGLIQLWPYESVTNGPETGPAPMPADIREWVVERCYDCHSNQTRWPWYSSLAPLSWWIANDVRRGRAGLNFSRWNEYTPRQRALGWRRSLQRIRENRMPPMQYSVLHPGPMNELQLNRLETFLKEQEMDAADRLSAAELLAWPATPLTHASQPLRGAFRVSGTLSQPLHLDNALLLGQGDLNVNGGIRGNGAILATGKTIHPGVNRTDWTAGFGGPARH